MTKLDEAEEEFTRVVKWYVDLNGASKSDELIELVISCALGTLGVAMLKEPLTAMLGPTKAGDIDYAEARYRQLLETMFLPGETVPDGENYKSLVNLLVSMAGASFGVAWFSHTINESKDVQRVHKHCYDDMVREHNEMLEQLRWSAQTVHQAHHEGSIDECRKNTCESTMTMVHRISPLGVAP